MKLNQTEVRKRKPKVCWPVISILFFSFTDWLYLSDSHNQCFIKGSFIVHQQRTQQPKTRIAINFQYAFFLIAIRFFLHDNKLQRLFSVT